MGEIVSRKQLREMGYSRGIIESMTTHPLSKHYLFKTEGGGKFYYDLKKFEKYRNKVLGVKR